MKATQLDGKHNGENSVTSLWSNSLLINMHLTYEDKASIKLVRQQKGLGAKRICKEFPNKNWAVSSVKDLLRKIDKTNSISRKVGSGWKRTVRTTQNIERVAELICSQEGNPGSSKSPKEIQKLTGISRTSDRGFGGSQRQSVYLLGQSRPTTDQQSHWSVATKIENCS